VLSRPVSGPSPRARRPSRWLVVGVLTGAVGFLFTLGALRDRFPAVPDLAWFAAMAALLGTSGVTMARRLPSASACRERLARRRLAGRTSVLLGAVGLSTGVLSVSAQAEGWSDGERSVSALVFCVALALLPFGLAVLRRAAREARVMAGKGSLVNDTGSSDDDRRAP
jgi:hypothetical protein